MSFTSACRKVSTLLQSLAIHSPVSASRSDLRSGGAFHIVCRFKEEVASFSAFPGALYPFVRRAAVTAAGIRPRGKSSASRISKAEVDTMAEKALGIKVGFIGAGQMAEAMGRGFSKSGIVPASQQFATDPSEARKEVFESFGATPLANHVEVAEKSDVIFLAVKPYVVKKVLEELQSSLSERHLIVSIAAGVTLQQLQAAAGKGARIVRVMPNTHALWGRQLQHATEADGELVKKLFSAVGIVHVVPENLLDAVTGLSGSGPAYVFIAIEALADGGVAAGLPRDIALSLAAQTVKGAAEMVLQTSKHPGVLKDSVASPGGTTIAGIRELEKGGLRSTLINAVLAAAERSTELSE